MNQFASGVGDANLEEVDRETGVAPQVGKTATSTAISKETSQADQGQDDGSSNTGSGTKQDGGTNTSGSTDDGSDHVNFETSGTVFVKSETKTHKITYEPEDGVTLNYLVWEGWQGNGFHTIANATFNEDQTSLKPEKPFIAVTNASATLNFTMFDDDNFNVYTQNAMRLLMNWHTDELEGETPSELFAVVNDEGSEAAASTAIAALSTVTPTAETVSTIEASSTATGTDGSSATATGATTSDNSKSSKSGGGLGTGAIAGIAVGAILGVALIGVLAWFFLRKRRQNKKLAEGYTATDSGNAYVVDKETHARTTDSPNSPYSDENATQSVPLETTTRDEPAIVAAERGLPRTSTSGSQGGRSGAETPQGGVSANVAHLVEDGMTADEIRRLEEEERQLDDEIERAARR
ncbi:hypothetical protein G7Z17_g13745 [Cylindrodendrum hubeiense]|uniref:Mid2 domain-containing protein n=1 Tax=Cylindrodendrum hubeiense TaxID=595255 RepID=A0A9P5L998_9HYPO|nr:hypothetical protein G7Z17_g13745 [Cylindrodendrum hubeiense]